jgi:hypothetical protein
MELNAASEISSYDMLRIFYNTCELYMKHGARSSKKVDYYHGEIIGQLKTIFVGERYKIAQEYDVPAVNPSGKKKCDIVVLCDNIPIIVLPVKIIMTNYKQNKNNYFENQIGEVTSIKLANPGIKVVPVNIFMSKTPYLNSSKIITKFESITYSDIAIYEKYKEHKLFDEVINYIIDVEHENIVNETYQKIPKLVGFNVATPYISLSKIMEKLSIK